MTAEQRWSEQLAALAVPEHVLAEAPEPVHGFSVALFDRLAADALTRITPSRRRALEALPEGGTVLDVGCGAGAASLALAPHLGRAVGVDESEAMLAAFAARARSLGVEHAEVRGRWPDVAGAVAQADVVVCHHVFYNAPDLGPFARALDSRARHHVVVETTARHPLVWLRPFWWRLHGFDRPAGPTIDDAVAVLHDLGFDARVEHWQEPSPWHGRPDEAVSFVRRRLGLPEAREDDVRSVLDDVGIPATRELVTLWWPSRAQQRTG